MTFSAESGASKELAIACAITSQYTLPLLVTLTSLVERLRRDYRPILYLLHQGLSRDHLAAIASVIETHPVVPSASRVAAIPTHSRFPREAAYPLLLADVLPETLQRVLFLDADLLVLDDLAKLVETPMGQKVLAAVQDSAVPLCSSSRGVKHRRELGVPDEAVYFNGGVLLIDLPKWRERDVTRRACGYLQRTGRKADFLHQEALNAILWDDWLMLDPRWNLLASVAGRPFERPPSENWRHPGIVHFAGRLKPWRAPVAGPFNAPYSSVLSRVVERIPSPKATLRDKLLSLYDRHLRNSLYDWERALWNRGIL